MENMLEALKKYFAETPREKVEADWAKSKQACKGINSPTVKEFLGWQDTFRKIVIEDKSSNYSFLNLYNPTYNRTVENYKSC